MNISSKYRLSASLTRNKRNHPWKRKCRSIHPPPQKKKQKKPTTQNCERLLFHSGHCFRKDEILHFCPTCSFFYSPNSLPAAYHPHKPPRLFQEIIKCDCFPLGALQYFSPRTLKEDNNLTPPLNTTAGPPGMLLLIDANISTCYLKISAIIFFQEEARLRCSRQL